MIRKFITAFFASLFGTRMHWDIDYATRTLTVSRERGLFRGGECIRFEFATLGSAAKVRSVTNG